MAIFRSLILAMMLAGVFSSQAMAYQYGYYRPASYSAPPAYYQPYARPPYPYHHAPRRYRTQHVYTRANQPVSKPAIENSAGDDFEINARSTVSTEARASSPVSPQTQISETGLSAKKQQFINSLLPYIANENRRLSLLRDRVQQICARLEDRITLEESERQLISKLAIKYRVDGNPLDDSAARDDLLRRIDIIPASMALAQAANESAWGESRFAREANNLFGIWTYDEEKGLKPQGREEGKKHLVRIFDGFGESVRYYMYTLNSHPAYEEMRNIRQQLRDGGQVIDGHALAAGLEKYSAKGQLYIELIQDLIRQNEWAQLDAGDQSS